MPISFYPTTTFNQSEQCGLCEQPLNNGNVVVAHNIHNNRDTFIHPFHRDCIKQCFENISVHFRCPYCCRKITSLDTLFTLKERTIIRLKEFKHKFLHEYLPIIITSPLCGILLSAPMLALPPKAFQAAISCVMGVCNGAIMRNNLMKNDDFVGYSIGWLGPILIRTAMIEGPTTTITTIASGIIYYLSKINISPYSNYRSIKIQALGALAGGISMLTFGVKSTLVGALSGGVGTFLGCNIFWKKIRN